ncbi:unnamed protein product [marine sediment metagenome]|uniref:Uncharacterized protein n=1 Tax=marine sediment metagenome TaxID=412755 RepID=X1ISQ0_9ZZZZ
MPQIMFVDPQQLDLQKGDTIILSGKVNNFSANADGITSVELGEHEINIEQLGRDAHHKLRGSLDTALSSRQPVPSP